MFINLVYNACYARQKGGARRTINPPTSRHWPITESRSVEVRIRDNGTGIPPAMKGRVFNPFFTTKPAGEGTGLGLSISHDIIVKQHGGTIDVDTEPGEFTEFRIVLPRGAERLTKAGENA